MKLRKPPKGKVWIYIDSLDREDGCVWELSYWEGDKFRTHNSKELFTFEPVKFRTRYFESKLEPRAVIEFDYKGMLIS